MTAEWNQHVPSTISAKPITSRQSTYSTHSDKKKTEYWFFFFLIIIFFFFLSFASLHSFSSFFFGFSIFGKPTHDPAVHIYIHIQWLSVKRRQSSLLGFVSDKERTPATCYRHLYVLHERETHKGFSRVEKERRGSLLYGGYSFFSWSQTKP